MVSVDVKLFAYLLTYLLTYWPVQQAGCIPYARVLVQVWSREAVKPGMDKRQVIVVCPADWLPCLNTTRCYRTSWACDGFAHCPLSDDELGCRECMAYTFSVLVNFICYCCCC